MILSNIQKKYNDKVILEDINLTINPKEFLVILGSSGSGKSTLLKIIAGIETANQGSISHDGKQIDNLPMQLRDIGYIFQEPLLFPHMTVRENVSYSLVMAKMPKDEISKKCDEYMALLQIEELSDRMPNQLSGGQKQRVAIARAIINSPKMLLMDEPFSSLDYNLRIQMGQMLQDVKEKLGLTIVFVTHDISESMLLGDRIAFLNDGHLIEQNTPQEMYYNPLSEETAKFMGEYNAIEGQYIDGKFVTNYGAFDTPQNRQKLFIRPNKVRLIPSDDGTHVIDKILSNGKETRIILKDDPLIIDTYFIDNLKVGQKTNIHFEI